MMLRNPAFTLAALRFPNCPKRLVVCCLLGVAAVQAMAQPPGELSGPDWRRHATAIGVTRQGEPLLAVSGTWAGRDPGRRQLLFVVAPMEEREWDAIAAGLVDSIVTGRAGGRSLVGAPPGATAAGSRADLTRGYPPQGGFYDHSSEPERRYLWRWIGIEPPDLVVEVVAGEGEHWFVPESDLPPLRELAGHLPGAMPLPVDDSLAAQLVREKPAGVGVVPAVRVVTGGKGYLATLDAALSRIRLPPAPARVELERRAARSAREISGQLLQVYGKKLDSVVYIPALALIGRLRQERIDHGAAAAPSPTALEATRAYAADGKPSLGGSGGSSVYPGHLVFGELATLTGDRRYVELVRAAADAAFAADGTLREAMPLHNEMSDAVFMGCPILAQAARLTGEARYADACLRNLRFIEKLCLRQDGLYRHSPLDESAWGRGNGFPALGLCWSLDELPDSSPVRDELLAAHRAHLAALLPHQDFSGCWHQVIDHPESYREFTATAMITYALMRGIRAGRLDASTFGPPAERAWEALKRRIADDGTLVDVCTGTGKQRSLRDYYDRPAILGRDDRGGAMALLVATERQQYEPLLQVRRDGAAEK
jgi:unsaturated rhamnogalacturonyl hydrolase